MDPRLLRIGIDLPSVDVYAVLTYGHERSGHIRKEIRDREEVPESIGERAPMSKRYESVLPVVRTTSDALVHLSPRIVMSQLTVDLPSHISSDEARLLLSIKLYEGERVSLGKAAEMAGYSKRSFMDLLAKKGIPVINISPEDLDRELDA